MEFPIGVNWVNGILWDEGLHILYAYKTKKKSINKYHNSKFFVSISVNN